MIFQSYISHFSLHQYSVILSFISFSFSVCLSISVSLCLFLSLSVFFCLSVFSYLSLCLLLSICLSVCLSVSLNFSLYVCLSLSISLCLFLSLSQFLSVSSYFSLSCLSLDKQFVNPKSRIQVCAPLFFYSSIFLLFPSRWAGFEIHSWDLRKSLTGDISV